MRSGSSCAAVLALTVLSSLAHAEPRARLAVASLDAGPAMAQTGPPEAALRPHALPTFLLERASAHGGRESALLVPAAPEWLRLEIGVRERPALRFEGGAPAPAQLATLDEVTRQLEALDLVGLTNLVPLLEPVRVISSLVTAQANQLLARGMSVEVGDRVDTRYTPLRGLAGDIQRGQYLRADDVTGRQFNFDLRLVLAWRPTGRVRLEAGYAVAYLSGDGRDLGQPGPMSERSTNYFLHGPCAAFNLEF